MAMADDSKIPFIEKIGYSLGDGAANFVFLTMVNFQGPFYTDALGVDPSTAGTISFCARLWDAFFDPFMGFIADRTRTRWGRFRPWLLWTSIPWAIMMVLAFTVPALKGYWPTFIYATATNIAMWTIYSMNNTPYSALMAVITGNQKQRTSLSQYRFIFAMVAQLIVGGFTLALMQGFGNPVPPQPTELAKSQLAMVQTAATQPEAKLPFTLASDTAAKPVKDLTANDMPAMVEYKAIKVAHDIDAWPKTMMVYAVICFVCFILCFLLVRERIHPVDDPDAPKLTLGGKFRSMGSDMKLLKGNWPWLVMFLVTITHYVLSQTRGWAYTPYCQYVLNPDAMKHFLEQWHLPTVNAQTDISQLNPWYKFLNASKLVIYVDAKGDSANAYTVVYGLLQMTNKLWNVVGIIAASFLIGRFNKKFVVSASLIANTVFIIAIYFVPMGKDGTITNIWTVYILEWMGQLAYAPTVPLLWVLFADVCDYTEWKFGRNITGFLYATFFFALKAGLSIGSKFGGWVLTLYGYKANNIQTPDSIRGIILTFTLVPGIFSVACALSMLFYPITKKMNNQIADDLAQRRADRLNPEILPPAS